MEIKYKYVGNNCTDDFKEVDEIKLNKNKKDLKAALKEIDKWGMFLCVAYLKIPRKQYVLIKSNISGALKIEDVNGNVLSSRNSYNSKNQTALSMYNEFVRILKL